MKKTDIMEKAHTAAILVPQTQHLCIYALQRRNSLFFSPVRLGDTFELVLFL